MDFFVLILSFKFITFYRVPNPSTSILNLNSENELELKNESSSG